MAHLTESTHPKLMIGVATAQNTVNTVPAIQLGVQEFCFVQTQGEIQDSWVANASKGLKKNKIQTRIPIKIPKKIDDDFIKITQLLREKLDPKTPLIINLGGGLKVHSLALWELFTSRKNSFDQACYSNPQKGVIDFWKWEGETITHSISPLDYEDELEHFLDVFGFTITDPGIVLYEKGEISYTEEVFNFFKFPEFREFLSKTFKSRNTVPGDSLSLEKVRSLVDLSKPGITEQLVNDLKLKNIGQITWTPTYVSMSSKHFQANLLSQIFKFVREKLLVLDRLPSDLFQFRNEDLIQELEKRGFTSELPMNGKIISELLGEASGFYFEKVLMQEVVCILAKGNHIVKKAFANVKVESKDAEAEFDILLLTSQGTFFVLDGKLDEFERKDENSRKFNVNKSGGVFSSFIPVFSFYPEDLNSDWLGNSITQKIKDYHLQGGKYMVFNHHDPTREPFSILNEDVPIPHLKDFLSYLKLNKR
jgi:hypothetical protein